MSHSSPGPWTASPQTLALQSGLHAWPTPFWAPSSHASPGSTLPSPQAGGAAVSLSLAEVVALSVPESVAVPAPALVEVDEAVAAVVEVEAVAAVVEIPVVASESEAVLSPLQPARARRARGRPGRVRRKIVRHSCNLGVRPG